MKTLIYLEDAIDAVAYAEDGKDAQRILYNLPTLPIPEDFDPENLTYQDKRDILDALDFIKSTIDLEDSN